MRDRKGCVAIGKKRDRNNKRFFVGKDKHSHRERTSEKKNKKVKSIK